MAQRLFENDHDNFRILTKTDILKTYIIYEDTAQPIGVGASRPYVGIFVELDAIGSNEAVTSGAGKLRTVIGYTDNSEVQLTSSDGPLNGQNIQTAQAWYNVHGDGTLKLFGSTPTASSTVRQSPTDSARERLPLDASKTPSYIDVYWTND